MTDENEAKVAENEEDFVRRWSERAFDKSQLAAIEAIHEHIIDYALTAWRPMYIEPPQNVLLQTLCEEGVVLMTINHMGDWRTNLGQPHKPPRAWMPAAAVPKPNGKSKL